MNRTAILTLFSAIVISVVSAQTSSAQDKAPDALAAKLAEICRKQNVPALSVATVNSDGLLQSQCFGIRKRGANDKVQLSDRFPLGSCTKSMTATLAAALVESGKIAWDTTIGDVWPTATDEHIHPKLRSITLDELLSHQSGLPSDLSGRAWLSFFDEKQSPPLERRRMLKLLLPKAPEKPQRKFSYANLGYVVVAAMLETRAGQPYESLMKKHIFDPLEMKSADFRTMKSAEQLRPPLLWGHQANGKPIDPRAAGAENPSVYASCGTVHLSIEDYAKYAQWHLAGNPSPVLQTQAAFDHLHEPLVDHSLPNSKYGCGWICMDSGLGPALNHGGSNTNAFALIWVFPKADFAAVVCTNTGEPNAFPACNDAIVHLMTDFATSKR